MDLDLWHFVHAEHPVIAKVLLLNAAVLDRDLAVKRGGQAENDAALHLGGDRVGIDHLAAIDRTDDAIDLDLAVLRDRDLSDLSDIAAKTLVNRNAAADPALGGLSSNRPFQLRV